MKRLILAALSTIALFGVANPVMSAQGGTFQGETSDEVRRTTTINLNDRFDAARQGRINKLSDRFDEARDGRINKVTPDFEQERFDRLSR